MTLENKIINLTLKAVQELYGADLNESQVTLQETRKEFDGQITVVIFPIIRFSKKAPEQTGNEIGEYLKTNIEEIVDFNVIKGFLNLSAADQYWVSQLKNEVNRKDYGQFPTNGKKVMVEYSSPIPISRCTWVMFETICLAILSQKY
jgi:arginyl-tRNA synthetase